MTCVHKVRWSVKRPEDCRFRLSVSHYKDRIVAPDEYTGATEVTPSDQTQVLQTKDRLVRKDITVEGITGTQTITENGTYDVVGDKSVTVDIPATGYDKGTLIYEGDFTATTSEWNVKTLPDGSAFSFDKIIVEISHINGSTNSGWRNYWRSDLPMTGNHAQVANIGNQIWRVDNSTDFDLTLTIEIDGAYINFLVTGQDNSNPTKTKAGLNVLANGGYDKITGYGWWFWALNAGAHIKITGYNRTS